MTGPPRGRAGRRLPECRTARTYRATDIWTPVAPTSSSRPAGRPPTFHNTGPARTARERRRCRRHRLQALLDRAERRPGDQLDRGLRLHDRRPFPERPATPGRHFKEPNGGQRPGLRRLHPPRRAGGGWHLGAAEEGVAASYKSTATYPRNACARGLQMIARFLSADLGRMSSTSRSAPSTPRRAGAHHDRPDEDAGADGSRPSMRDLEGLGNANDVMVMTL